MTEQQALGVIEKLFHASTAIRYVAVYQKTFHVSRQRSGLEDASASESDRYEELLVNPALLLLAEQRGNIDCGGLRFIVVAYGNFFQLVRRYEQGHLSICLEAEADPLAEEEKIRDLIR